VQQPLFITLNKKVRILKKENDIFVYTTEINFNISKDDFKKSLNLLTTEEQNEIILKKTYKLRCQSLMSTLLIKKAIRDTLGLSESSFQIKRTKMNRPYIETSQKINIDFNISHSNEWIVCAISPIGRIGVDIEQILPIDINIAKEFLSCYI
jgi:4'-phosphopantetheinyl transferase